jgi:hypothetical protein
MVTLVVETVRGISADRSRRGWPTLLGAPLEIYRWQAAAVLA